MLRGGNSIDKTWVEHHQPKKSPQERAAEHESKKADAEAARRAEANINGGQAYPSKPEPENQPR